MTVGAATIDAVTETTTSINGNTGGTTASLTANDTLNGNPVVIGTNPGQVKLTGVTVPTGLTLNANGTVTVAANTPAGNYNVEYTICEITNPGNCDTVTSVVTVGAATIDAVTETTTSINGNTGGTTASLTANDTLNGNPVVIGTNPGQVKLTGVTVPTGLTLNANGTVTVAANTPAGNYNVEYTICEITNTGNCDTVTSVVAVGAATIDAVTETTTSINGNTGGTTASLTTNDTLNGNPVVIGTNPGQVKLTGVTVPTGLTLNANGTVTVAANTPAGNYNVEYTICEITNPGNCDTVTSIVTVGAATIDAVTETTTSINGNTGGTTVSLTANDTLNGNAVVIGTNPGQVKLTGVTVPIGLTLNANGTVTVAANTPAGNYNVEYTICEITNTGNCDTVTSIVTVSAGTLVANADTVPSVVATNANQTLVNVFTNDTKNGVALVPSDVNLTVTTADPTGYLTLDTNGNAVLGANAPAGNYELTYTICEKLNPTNCSSNTVKVTVGSPVIDAVTETTTSINGNTGGTTTSLTANDTLNGNPVVIGTNPGQVKLTGVTVPTGLTLNANGTVSVAANTPAGNYNVEYTICEITNTGNCDTVTSVVAVTAATLVANADTVPSVVATNAAQTLVNVFDNDTKNGLALVPSDVNLTVTTADPTGYLTLDTNGNAVLGANAPAGNYELTYTICEKLNPTNCSSNTVKVTVGSPVIDAVTETTTSINGNTGGTTASLTANDTLNGNPVVIGTNPGQVKLTGVTVPTGLTLNANGTVTVAANTPAGNYNVEYTICEITNTGNCDTVTSIVTVGAATIDAVTETTTSINGNTGGTTASLTANDTLNGNPVVIGTNPGQVKLTGVTVPTGLTLNANGTVSVAANTPAGNYNVEYTICEITNTGNCDTVTSIVTVSAGTLVANADTVPSVVATNASQTLVNVFDNDTKNGVALVPSDVNLTVTTADPTGYLTIDTNGNAVLGANAPAGNYELTYTICEKLNPTNCSSNTVKVTVGLATIDAVTETTTSINGNTGGTTASLTANDTLNGNPVVIGTNPGQVKLTGVTVPTGLTLNANGTVTVAANTPAGNYNVEYTICEITNPGNCDTVTSVVPVGAATIDAVTETTTSINGNTGGTTASLTSNDTLNGNSVVIGTSPGQVKLTGVTVPTGLTLNANGTVSVAANTPAGNYNVEYTICEITNPGNCDTVTSIVTVGAATIDAVTETTTSINGNTGGTTASLTANDTLNGNPVVIGTNPGQVKLTGVTVPTGLTLNANGTVTVAANTPAGNYNVEYTICEITNPSNCDTVTSIVTVSAGTLVANADTVPSVVATNASQTLVNVFDNDTKNGLALVPSDVNLTVTTADPTGYLTLDTNGNAVLGANAPAGNYELTYTICEKLNPTNCSSNTVKVTVGLATIDAVTETTTSINGNTGGTTASLTANDTLNGNPIVIGTNPGQVKLTGVTVPTGLTLNANGTVTVAANTPAGNYNVEYTICEITNPGNCDTVTSVITVSAGTLVANADTVPSVVATNATQTLVNVFTNDTKNGLALVPSDVNMTVATADPTGYLTLDTNGNAVLGANAPAGNYELTYTICEKLNPTNCSSNTVKVTVGSPVIDAVTETTTSINGNTGGTTASLTANDTLNGNPVVIGTNPGQVKLTGVTVPTGLTLNANGTVTVAANTPAGNYNVEYTICEITNTGNCDTVTSIVTVSAGTLVANADTVPSVVATNANQTLVNVFTNDTKNGVALVPSDVNLTVTTADPTGYLTLDTNGNAVLGANAPAGNYELTYTICEKLNPTNCSSNTVKITVGLATIDAVTETTTSINGNTGGTTASLTANDTLNGNPVVIGTNPGQVKLTGVSVPTGLTLNANGTVSVAANTPAGNYNVEYTICEITNTGNCDTVTSIVTVSAGTLVANADTVPSVVATNANQTLVNVFDNDTKNGLALVPSDVNLTVTTADPTGYLTLDTNGNAVLGANAPAGNYELTYTICEKLNPTNCSSNTVKVTVGLATIDAVTETTTSINGNTGGTTVSLTSNDTLNGNPVVIGTNPGQVKLTGVTVPTGLTLNANGTVTVAANTPAGNYNVEYTICEITNPSNCDTVTSIVTVGLATIDAVTETTTSINGNTGGTTASLTANDTLNGNPVVIGTNPGQVKLTGVTVPTGLTLNANGTVTVAANTASGNYNIEYTICEITNPGNCDTVTSVVPVGAATIDAVTETTTIINGNTGGTTASLTANDTLNGNPVVIGTNPGQIKLTGVTVPTGLTLNANGTVTVAANTPAGNYNVEYTICEITNPGNCDTVTSVITVSAGTLIANADTVPSVVATNTAQTLVNVFDNDTKNGIALVPSDVNLTVTTADPTGYLTLDTNGNAVLGANAPAGNYELTYTICEKLNPTNCSSNTVKVTVNGGTLVANADTVASVVGINTPQTLVNVFTNDTKNGLALVPSDVNLNVTTADPTGYLTVDTNGNAVLGANAPAGNYELNYTICEKLNPSNCSTASVKVVVVAPTMTITANSYCSNNVPYVTYNVVANNFTPTNLLTVKWIDSSNNVVATQTNLPLSGNILWPGAIVDGNGNGVDWPGWIFANGEWTEGVDGFENTRKQVTMQFSLNPTQDVVVEYPAPSAGCNAQPTFVIKANNDTAGPIDVTKTTSASLNIFDNDTFNGLPINPANTILSTVVANNNLVLNADGSVNVKPGTPSGTYQLTYQICDISNSGNCSQAVVNVTVLNSVIPVTPTNPIVANDDAEVAVDGVNGSLEFINILDNDLLSGLPVNAIDVIITNTSGNANFEFNSDGTVNVLPGTPGAHYTLAYQICEKANPSNCSSAILNVFVEVPSIAIVKTAIFNDENNSKYANAGETITYKFKITNTGNVPLKNITITDPLPGVVVSGQPISLDVNEIDENTFTATYIIKQSDINLGSVTNQATVQGTSERGVVVDDKSDDTDNSGDKATVISLSGCVIKVFNAFSPNGDSKNTRFYIQGLECYPDNTVEIYNRWGVLVFDMDHYNNEDRAFKGYSEGKTTVKQSDGLPVGTYYYILKYKDSDSNPHELTGYLYINK
ncbi:gliding motility-associated C-terminal domain-containing protein [Flavobacterium sp. HTF]|uniref:gliding motility-associated C-terminal domain-containing protein n=1 Tax=Flavobacterium sp. HTF TaxID=2170732 RepID=UPI001A9C5A93|nr:gliding motility-associated C-terminal domain-containing protein [Flavobacterium sp. HTF]